MYLEKNILDDQQYLVRDKISNMILLRLNLADWECDEQALEFANKLINAYEKV